jgi:hypothetical protein
VEILSEVIYAVLGKPIGMRYATMSESLRWSCGCIAIELTSRRMLLARCMTHEGVPFENGAASRG